MQMPEAMCAMMKRGRRKEKERGKKEEISLINES